MKIRIGNDIRLDVTLINSKVDDNVNIKSIKAYIRQKTKLDLLAAFLSNPMSMLITLQRMISNPPVIQHGMLFRRIMYTAHMPVLVYIQTGIINISRCQNIIFQSFVLR